LAGRLVVSFVILPNGSVTAAALSQDTLGDAPVSTCVLQAARRWPFPQPEGGGIVKVSYPFTFAPAGGAD
jgi:TonB family protein